MDETLENRLAFEKLVSRISSRFISFDDLDLAINNSLEDMGSFRNASRAYIFLFSEDNTIMDNTHEWCAEGVTPEINNLKGLPIDTFPWWMKKLKDGEIILITDVSAMPPEAATEKEILEQQDIKSVLVLPIYIQKKLTGFLGFDNITTRESWSSEDQALLQITAEIFSNAFSRKYSEQALRSTERQRMEIELKNNAELQETIKRLKETQSQLIQQEQLAGIGQLAAGVAHEINNPLAIAMSNCNLLLDELNSVKELNPAYNMEELEDIAKDIEEGLRRVDTIVKSLSAFSRVDNQAEFKEYDLQEGIRNTLVVANNAYKYYAEIECDFKPVPAIEVNPGQINQVLLNLLLNAAHSLKTKHIVDKQRGLIRFSISADTSYLYCSIEDNGIGISKENLSKIFNPFFTTKPVGEGTGLGLSIVYDIIVNKHRGEVEVASELGEGAVFTLKLPLKKR